MAETELTADVLIIGAGPAGCTAALYAARAGLTAVVISPTELSGMMTQAPRVENFPGQPPQPGKAILDRIREQALTAGARQILDSVGGVNFRDPQRLEVFGGGGDYSARAVILATGAMARSRKTPGEDEFHGRGIGYCVACDGPLFRDRDVLVVGQDEEAAREALALSGIARAVRLVAPAPELRLEGELLQTLEQQPNLQLETGYRLESIIGEDEVTGVVFHTSEGEERTFEAEGVFLYLRGAAPATEFLHGAVETDEKGYVKADELRQTSVPGVYAAGDVCRKEARQMVIAAAEGCLAALVAERYLRGRPTMRLDRGELKR